MSPARPLTPARALRARSPLPAIRAARLPLEDTDDHRHSRPAGTGTARPRPSGRRPAPRPRRKKGEGQWALGYREPLNANEQFKKDDDPLNVRARIENIYAKRGFDSIDPGDLRGRFRWWGLYTQRGPGIDGGKTAILEPEELDDEYFMLRVRIDGGALTTEQLRVIGQISVDFGRDTADITDRQNVQLHWIRIEDVPEIWRRLEAVGLSTTEACGDCPRVILGSPVAGIAADEIIDGTPAIREIADSYIGDRRSPTCRASSRRRSPVSRCTTWRHEINDIAFVGVVHPEHGPGFDLWVGGGLSTNPMLAVRLGAWVPVDEVAEVWAGVIGIFRDYGYRRLRTRARLKFLVADWGAEKFREVLETEYLKRPLIDGPAPAIPEQPGDHVGVHPQKDGRFYVGLAPVAGRVSGSRLIELADLAEAHGSGRVRTTPKQKILVLDVPGRPGRLAGRRRRGARPVGPRPTPAGADDGLHRHRVLQAGHRRDQGARPGSVDELERGSATSTRRSPSTSTAARTPAPVSRSPTSVSRAS